MVRGRRCGQSLWEVVHLGAVPCADCGTPRWKSAKQISQFKHASRCLPHPHMSITHPHMPHHTPTHVHHTPTHAPSHTHTCLITHPHMPHHTPTHVSSHTHTCPSHTHTCPSHTHHTCPSHTHTCPITHPHMSITHHPHICRRTKRTRGYPLEYLTSLVLRVSKSTVLSNCASTFATRICSNSLFTTSSSWNRQSMTKNASSGNTLSSKIIKKSLISCQPSH